MRQLLSIKRVPIDVQVNITPWRFERSEAEKTQARKEAMREAQPAAPLPVINDFSDKDYFEFGNDQPMNLMYQPLQAVSGFDYGSDYSAEEGDLVAQVRGNPIRARMASRPIESVTEKIVAHTPRHNKEVINWSNGRESYNFQAGNDGDFTAISALSEWTFVPSSVEVVVKQLPSLDIEYLGTPLYFPRSADPDYVPPEI
jgi:hypothetical protein